MVLEAILTRYRARMRRCASVVVIVILAALTSFAQTFDEYEVKAAFLYNLTKFVEWPFEDKSSNFYICILGDDPFGSAIDRLTKGKTVDGRDLKIRRLKDPADVIACHVVFVPGGDRNKAGKALAILQRLPVLTVGEDAEFGKMGGHISLSIADEHVQMQINIPNTEASGLKISAKLMSLAKRSSQR